MKMYQKFVSLVGVLVFLLLMPHLGQAAPPAQELEYYVYLPMMMNPPCDSIGESNNIADSLDVSSGQSVCGQVSESTDPDDVYKIYTQANDRITISMTGDGGNADLYFYPPSATDIYTNNTIARSTNDGNTELVEGILLDTAYWYIDVRSITGTTNYNLIVTLSDIRTGEEKIFTVSGTTENALPQKHRQEK